MLYEKFKNGFLRTGIALAILTAIRFYFPIREWVHHGPIGEHFSMQEVYQGIIAGGWSFKGWVYHLIPGLLTITLVYITFKIAVHIYSRLIRFILAGFDEDLALKETPEKTTTDDK